MLPGCCQIKIAEDQEQLSIRDESGRDKLWPARILQGVSEASTISVQNNSVLT